MSTSFLDLKNKYLDQMTSQQYQCVQLEKDIYPFFVNTTMNQNIQALIEIFSKLGRTDIKETLQVFEIISKSYPIAKKQAFQDVCRFLNLKNDIVDGNMILYYEHLLDISLRLVEQTHNLNPYYVVMDEYLHMLYHLFQNKEDLIAHYPELKEYQIAFYEQHHELGVYYSISQFQDFCHTSYETSRQAMELMVDLELYRRRKIGKRYMYTSVFSL